ncbi:helix-turn-helix domain-containing protein [Mucilaginibacter jinjuensis]|uniref:Helix-turn-helix transcriptional regulator n=1 Tax=Mucilaginibacter jinjuensis TaxID=1176721 RepID=A0ABY7TAT2_9SPHI|nr:helix-turn-helix transcriptional regulator [Mucilaginibacter jinjuensis]WCT13457.1 helix-turn-helix transcriptional regulator [Mucilaginibacter jinjuensis]
MESSTFNKPLHIGKKIERVRKLRGMTQDDLGSGLNISKQAVSKLEQSESIDDHRLEQIATVLGVTKEGLANFNEDKVFNISTNFNEGCNVTTNSIYTFVENVNNPVEKIIELYENLLKTEREKVEILLNAQKE